MRAIIIEGSVKEISEFVKGLEKEKTVYDLEMEIYEKTHSGHKRTIFSSEEAPKEDKDISEHFAANRE